MAIYTENTVCSLCGEGLSRPFVGLSWFMSELPTEILKHGDSIMHIDCFDHWEHRLYFSQAAFSNSLSRWGHPSHSSGYILLQAERFLVVCGPPVPKSIDAPLIEDREKQIEIWKAEEHLPLYASVLLRDWDFNFRTQWDNWFEFINGDYRDRLDGFSQKSSKEIEAIFYEIRDHIPDLKSLRRKLEEQIEKT